MKPIEIKKGIYWIGVLHPDLRLFDVLFPTEHGTTYNSYLVKGEKTAVIDTAKGRFYEQFLSNVKSLVDPKDIDYIVCNHMEPDHSGSLAAFLKEAKNAQVVVSRTGEHYVSNILNADVSPLKMGDGDLLDLGGKTLRFIFAPFLHWPDTMFTYAVEDQVLFPCDVFGSHFCDEQMFNDLVGDFSHDFEFYYRGIMGPFKDKMLQALDKIKDLEIEIIGPSHGPILRSDPWKYVNQYIEWSTPSPTEAKKALIFYASAHGNTEMMAEEMAKGASIDGVEVEVFDLTETDPGEVLDRIEVAHALIVGSPTINGDAVKPVWDLLSSLATIRMKGKVGAAFGSYGWSGEAVGMIEDRLQSLKFKVPEPGLRFALVPTAEELESCREFGAKIAEGL
ncbi:MAG: MBL fold metallo-hydrolase [Chloroflexi bacterium B3_Chlor]|nr:MAG: MBL fold metallo-hydrolase [Chloroflexi bacterium B3_Chlor]